MSQLTICLVIFVVRNRCLIISKLFSYIFKTLISVPASSFFLCKF